MREEYEKDKYNFLPSESNELHPTFKIETTNDKMISLCSKLYCASDITEKIKFSCQGFKRNPKTLVIMLIIITQADD